MSSYYSYETIRASAHDVTLANGAKHRCIDPDALLDIEPANVRENVKGEWKSRTFYDSTLVCSECGAEGRWDFEFCPYCGAQMERGQNHEI